MAADDPEAELPLAPDPLAAGGADGDYDETEDLFDFEGYLASKATKSEEIDLDDLLAALGDDFGDDDEEPVGLAPDAPAAPGGAAAEPDPALSAPPRGTPARHAARVDEALPERRAEPVLVPVSGARVSIASVVLIAMGVLTLVNLGVIGFTWMAKNGMEESLHEIGRQVIETTEQIREDTARHAETALGLSTPIAASDPEKVQTFRRVEADISEGEFAVARKRLYSLLAVADRLDERVRDDVEARANFLLADTLRLEALASDGGAPR